MTDEQQQQVRRFGMAARLVGAKRDEYIELHRSVWPRIETALSASGIRNFTIFALDDYILGYYEYVGSDYEADQRRMAMDPITQDWWSYTAPCQRPLREDSKADNWELFTEIWHLD